MFRAGEIVGVAKLKSTYDSYVLQVLGDKIVCLPTQMTQGAKGRRRLPAKYRVKEDLPTREEYTALKHERFTTTVDALLEDGYGEIEQLASEVRDWFDNLGDNLQQSDKGQCLDEAASSLENIDKPEIPEKAAEIQIVFLPSFDLGSRAKRASEAADMIRSAGTAIHEWLGDNDINEGDLYDELTELADQCESHADEVEAVEFPGMYS